MDKILIIIKREFLHRVKKKSFFLMTLLMPLLFVAIAAVPALLAQIEDDGEKPVAVYDKTGRYAPLFKSDQAFKFQEVPAILPEFRKENSAFEAVVSITAPLDKFPDSVRIYSRSEIAGDLMSRVENTLNDQVHRDKIAAYNVPQLDKVIEEVQKSLIIRTVKWTDEGENESSTGVAVAVGFIFTFLIYSFILFYGGMVLQGVMEEKTNRIVEIMVSSVKPFQLMMGKIIGIALVGLVQFALWGILVGVLYSVAVPLLGLTDAVSADPAAMSAMAGASEMNFTEEMLVGLSSIPFGEIILLFFLYFVGGYLLYASFFAAVGASINEPEDSSQFMTPLILLMLFALYAGLYSIENPDGPLAFWASLFPLTSPIVMMVRLPFSVPLWQELLSVGLLYLTALFFVWFSARIYRVGILMYGKKPTIKELIKWIKYK